MLELKKVGPVAAEFEAELGLASLFGTFVGEKLGTKDGQRVGVRVGSIDGI